MRRLNLKRVPRLEPHPPPPPQPLLGSLPVNHTIQDHGPPPWPHLIILCQACIRSHRETSTSRAPNQPQYDLFHQLFRWSANPPHSIFAVFRLPDELILSILSHIAPDPHLTGPNARYCLQYCLEINDYHHRRMGVLRRLSMTCRAMRLRLLPWIWDLMLLSQRHHSDDHKSSRTSWEHATTALASHVDASLTARVRYLHALLCP